MLRYICLAEKQLLQPCIILQETDSHHMHSTVSQNLQALILFTSLCIYQRETYVLLSQVSVTMIFCVGICTIPLQYDFVNRSLGYGVILVHHI